MFKLLTIVLISLFSLSICNADDFTDAVLKAKKKLKETENTDDQSKLLKVRGDFERILQLKKNQWLIHYYLGLIDFSISSQYMEKQDKDNIKKYTQSSLEQLDECINMKEDFAEAWILKLAVNSNRWMYEPDKMNDIMARQTEAKDMAKKFEPDNPRLYLIDGMNTYYTPEQFGGGSAKAQPLFEKSYELFQSYKPVDETYPEWGEDQAIGMLAICFIGNDKLDDAKKWIDKGLEKYPDSGFLKEYVMKEYEKKKK